MGFIDWHGNKEDQYEEVLEFAKMKEKMETDNFGTQMKKKEVAKLFGVPSLVTMQNEEILHLLLKEKTGYCFPNGKIRFACDGARSLPLSFLIFPQYREQANGYTFRHRNES